MENLGLGRTTEKVPLIHAQQGTGTQSCIAPRQGRSDADCIAKAYSFRGLQV